MSLFLAPLMLPSQPLQHQASVHILSVTRDDFEFFVFIQHICIHAVRSLLALSILTSLF